MRFIQKESVESVSSYASSFETDFIYLKYNREKKYFDFTIINSFCLDVIPTIKPTRWMQCINKAEEHGSHSQRKPKSHESPSKSRPERQSELNHSAYKQTGIGDELQIRHFGVKVGLWPLSVWIGELETSVAIMVRVITPLTVSFKCELIRFDAAEPTKQTETVRGCQRHPYSGADHIERSRHSSPAFRTPRYCSLNQDEHARPDTECDIVVCATVDEMHATEGDHGDAEWNLPVVSARVDLRLDAAVPCQTGADQQLSRAEYRQTARDYLLGGRSEKRQNSASVLSISS
jgi:hypothetical protein